MSLNVKNNLRTSVPRRWLILRAVVCIFGVPIRKGLTLLSRDAKGPKGNFPSSLRPTATLTT